jgi:hypothetical protein
MSTKHKVSQVKHATFFTKIYKHSYTTQIQCWSHLEFKWNKNLSKVIIKGKSINKKRFQSSLLYHYKSREWLTVNCVVNVTKNCLPSFYIFRSERIRDDYMRLCKASTCMAMQTKAWITFFLFKEFLSFFKKSVLNEISQSNWHLLILDKHGSHVMLEVIAQAKEFGLDMVTSPTHTSHALQPLDVSCFKPLWITFQKERDNAMVKNNHYEPNKCTLIRWVNKSLD